MKNLKANPSGSIWHRWDPHIHAPGTVLNDQYKGDNPWEDFLSTIENSEPQIRALGITDYFSIDIYEEVLKHKQNGRLHDIELIFPNIELRLDIATAKNHPINVHLLVSPNDHKHIIEIRRFLGQLNFKFGNEIYRCENHDLIKLGKAHDKSIVDDKSALRTGVNQFKVSLNDLKKAFEASAWARKNILIAISGNGNDGTSGLSQDASFSALRAELQRYSHIIFSSNKKQREFWLGNGADTKEELKEKFGGCKPCLHGSDAHQLADVGKPDLDRYCWIKGDLIFESLKQTCIEPEDRVFIGTNPPTGGAASQIVEKVDVENAPWLDNNSVPVNSGLVTIIGARGSGKTALADLIAAGSNSLSSHINNRSFISRAHPLLENEVVKIQWGNNNQTENKLLDIKTENTIGYPKVQYLSQQFVEELCSAEGITDKLLDEIERIIFQSHPIEERMGTTSFHELLEIHTASAQKKRLNHENTLRENSALLVTEREKKNSLTKLRKQLVEKRNIIDNDKKDRKNLLGKDQEKRVKEHETISKALTTVRARLDQAKRRHQSLLDLKKEVATWKTTGFPGYLQKLKSKHTETNLSEEQWDEFQIVFSGDVDKLLTEEIIKAKKQIDNIQGTQKVNSKSEKHENSLIPSDSTNLNSLSHSLLSQELKRIQRLIGIDQENTNKHTKLSEKILEEEAVYEKIKRDIEDAKKSDKRIADLIEQRRTNYKEIFDAILDHETELISLYEPLMQHLQSQGGTVSKLTFKVKRYADIETWAEEGESLLDLRKNGPFKGKGALFNAIKTNLLNAWETGTSEEIAEAMANFRDDNEEKIKEHVPVERSNKEEFRNWSNKVAEWLYSTNHLTLSYSIQYDGIDIKQLSPGTRGIVLLLLYLAIDHDDNRPLIIDQPEENLDPKSIFDELVPRFREAKKRRQIIIVTHNANLVVNTDADQVIVASSRSHDSRQLPNMSYQSGGLENSEIRGLVCEILEGGENAFKERAKRLRVDFP